MSDRKPNDTTGRAESTTPAIPEASLKDFLENVPPSQARIVPDALFRDGSDLHVRSLDLTFARSICDSDLVFRPPSRYAPYINKNEDYGDSALNGINCAGFRN